MYDRGDQVDSVGVAAVVVVRRRRKRLTFREKQSSESLRASSCSLQQLIQLAASGLH